MSSRWDFVIVRFLVSTGLHPWLQHVVLSGLFLAPDRRSDPAIVWRQYQPRPGGQRLAHGVTGGDASRHRVSPPSIALAIDATALGGQNHHTPHRHCTTAQAFGWPQQACASCPPGERLSASGAHRPPCVCLQARGVDSCNESFQLD